MIIRTSQDAALVDCCPCDPPACDAPRKECESISVDACGFTLPTHTDVPAELKCKLYTVKTSSYEISIGLESESEESGGTVHYSYDDYQLATSELKKVYATVSGVRVCASAQGATSFTETESQDYTIDPPDPEWENPSVHYSASASSTEGPGATCSGSETYTYFIGEPPFTQDFFGCYVFSYSPDETWSFAGGVFSTYVPTEGHTGGTTFSVAYSLPVTLEMLTAELAVRIGMIEEGDPWGGGECSSSVTITNGYSEQDPPSPPAEPDPEFVPVLVCSQVSGVTKARYRIGIPAAWSDFDGRHASWVIAHADWVAGDPETRGDEPIEPVERTFFMAQWDEVFFPADWEEWKAIKAGHDAWVACNDATPGECGDEPPAPGTEPAGPSLSAARSWTYPGGGGELEFSEFFEIDVPATEGETRLANMLTKCHRNSGLGVKPTSHGEVYELT